MFPTWTLLLLILGSTSEIELPPELKCDGIFYYGKYYDKYMLFESHGKPYNMFYDSYSGQLLFSHTMNSGKEIDFQILTCNIKKRTCKRILGVPGGYAIGYDYVNDEIYFGGDQGLYKHNIETNHPTYFAERGKSIWGIFIKKNFYYIQHPSQQLYVYKKEKFVPVPETIGIEIDTFWISKDLNVYFSNSTGLFKTELKKGKKKPKLMSDKVEVRQIVEDLYGVVHFCASDGIYIEDAEDESFKRVAEIDQLYSITFIDHFHLAPMREINQLIYSDQYAIYVLMTGNYSSLCSQIYKFRKPNKPVKLVKVIMNSEIDSPPRNETTTNYTLDDDLMNSTRSIIWQKEI